MLDVSCKGEVHVITMSREPNTVKPHFVSAMHEALDAMEVAEAGAWPCGMVAGLIHDVPTVQELIDRIMDEAETIITERLAGMQSA